MSGILQQKRIADSRNETFRNEHLDEQEPAEYLGSSGTMHTCSVPGRRLLQWQQQPTVAGQQGSMDNSCIYVTSSYNDFN
jgi:hypothetical protein